MSLEARFAASMGRVLAGQTPARLAVAVSGGSDSLSLLGLACDWAGSECQITALTVDHNLRPEAAEEAALVTREAIRLGARHEILKWAGWDRRGNLQAEARKARYGLMHDYCARYDIPAILVGHTQDDQAETVLMRLARGSGVDGLSAIPEGRLGRDKILRPLLDEPRQDLRVWLSRQGMRWAEDPSNEDPRFDRVRARRILEHLDPLGLSAKRLAETAAAMARAQEALRARAADAANILVRERLGLLEFDAAGLAMIEEETRLRLMAHGLKCLSGEAYRPRLASLTSLIDRALDGQAGTLQGCHLIPSGERLILTRELKAISNLRLPAKGTALWDGRWQITCPDIPGGELRVLGPAGVAQIERPDDLPYAALLSLPGLWMGEELLAVPGLFNTKMLISRQIPDAEYHTTLKSH